MKKRLILLMSLCCCLSSTFFAAQQENQDEEYQVKTTSSLSASNNKKGDKFTVQVLSPDAVKNALIEAEVATAKASGKVKGDSQLSFHFNKLIMPDGTETPIQADLKEIRNSQGVANVDEEGRAIGKSSLKKDIAVTSALTGLGALIGAASNRNDRGKAAAEGAAIGAAVGLTIAFTTKGEDIKLSEGSVFVLRVAKPRERNAIRR